MPDDRAATAEPLGPGNSTGDALWDDWDTPPRVPPAPALHLDGFDGPLDLLLDLAERQRIELGRISVVALVEQFVAASERVAAYVTLERRADWLVMATRLVLLRSRLLFPPTPEAAEEVEREAEREVERLDGLRFVRAATAWLQTRAQLGIDVFARGRTEPSPRTASYMALMEACLTVLQGREQQPAQAPIYRPAVAGVFRIDAALARLRSVVAEMAEPSPLAALLPRLTDTARAEPTLVRSAVASTFVAVLELCRDAVVSLEQVEVFGPIRVAPLTVETNALAVRT